MEYVVEMLGIRKEFAGIVANDNITLTVRRGEIHALLGENGAGKSTLMNILFGLYQPDSGRIRLRGQEVRISNPNVANDLGIGMVHQHFQLIHNFTVTENIILGIEPSRFGIVNTQSASRQIKELSERYGLNIDPDAKIEDISVGMQQRVEILKMLYRDAEILIFDEPTAVLTPQEIADLIEIMKNLAAEGKAIILITHKLKEIKAAADRCTVIRRGRCIGTVDVASCSKEEMAEMMVGRPVFLKVEKEGYSPGAVLLKIKELTVLNQNKRPAVKKISFCVHAGEILGIAGIDGNGQAELVEAITGLRKIQTGQILLQGNDVSSLSIKERIDAGLAHVPEDRQKRGLVLNYSLEDNLVLEVYDRPPFSQNCVLNRPAVRHYATEIMQYFDVRAAQGSVTIARLLSGGNQQKAIIGREISLNPKVLIAVQPTRGLDVGSIEYIHRRLIAQRDAGYAVLLVSLELEEILNLSDRIAVISQGELIGLVQADATNENDLGMMMAGIRKEADY
ncbi:Galactose/methyl galactoside import ATP-binding protein MglA [Sporomusa ovata DSM 2662]|uniref:Unspecified monosaccharide ABC transport system, ATP-binding protein n=1 Tax=Sporomusa ovata TaxID=2378 RepID=A0A0U1L336_9FIRM|nr:ATP-binding cassette domain-containing protein [Sporomusa ovata]EQB25009.1 nucleoside ABC transporter ATP-binding protein [Sporomusa ovata DSM 2662]CQR73553.1 Unspecified monosaccharide ABC transport system, ATP-binding protein [Sporomusa ovata]